MFVHAAAKVWAKRAQHLPCMLLPCLCSKGPSGITLEQMLSPCRRQWARVLCSSQRSQDSVRSVQIPWSSCSSCQAPGARSMSAVACSLQAATVIGATSGRVWNTGPEVDGASTWHARRVRAKRDLAVQLLCREQQSGRPAGRASYRKDQQRPGVKRGAEGAAWAAWLLDSA